MKRREESGVALITVLCLIISASALVAALVAVSQTSTLNLRTYNEYMRSGYIAEGALARIAYLITADRTQNTTRTLGETDYEAADGERFLADGTEHEIDYYGTRIRYRINDANSGWNFSGNLGVNLLRQLAQSTSLDENIDTDALTTLSDILSDYIDTDTSVSGSGMESGDYEALELAPLPRDNALQFREELLYLPRFREFFPPDAEGRLSAIRLIPPDNLITLNANPTVFNATRLQLKSTAGLDDATAEQVLEALRIYREKGTFLSDQLEASVLALLQQNFSWTESGVYTVSILRPTDAKRPASRLSATFGTIPATGPTNGVLNYLEYFRY